MNENTCVCEGGWGEGEGLAGGTEMLKGGIEVKCAENVQLPWNPRLKYVL